VTALAVFRPTCAVCFKLCLLKCVLLLCTYSANMSWLDLICVSLKLLHNTNKPVITKLYSAMLVVEASLTLSLL